MCKHDVNWLVGTADGIVCRKCGKVFPNLETLHADLEAEQTVPAPVVAESKPKKTRKKKEDA